MDEIIKDKNKKEEKILDEGLDVKNKNWKMKILLILFVLLIGMDLITFFVFYDINDINDSNNSNYLQCEDGTKNEECSINKPFFCYGGRLLKKSSYCGCPNGLEVDFQDCK